MEIEITNVSIHDIRVNTFKCVCKTSLSTETYTTQSRKQTPRNPNLERPSAAMVVMYRKEEYLQSLHPRK